jgi:hypothetical protein
MFVKESSMAPGVAKAALLVLSVALAGSAFLGRNNNHTPRKLALVGSSLVALAGVARRHFEEDPNV